MTKLNRILKRLSKAGDIKKILYDKEALPFILEALDKKIDSNGWVIVSDTKKFVLDADGKPFQAKDLMGMMNGKFITDEIQLFLEVTRNKEAK